MKLDIFNLEQKGILTNDIFQEQNMSDMEKEETVKKPPTIAISPSFLYGVTAGVKVREPQFVSQKSIFCPGWNPLLRGADAALPGGMWRRPG